MLAAVCRVATRLNRPGIEKKGLGAECSAENDLNGAAVADMANVQATSALAGCISWNDRAAPAL
jgi:hypothetical protein